MELLQRLLSASPKMLEIGDVQTWWSRYRSLPASLTTADRAALGGFQADRAGYAFASGYQAAIESLFPRTIGLCAGLCATEKGGVHPRAIRSRLEVDGSGWRLSGEKSPVTLGPVADRLVVLASRGIDGRGFNRLAAVLLPVDREGVSVEVLPHQDFIPEIPHAVVRFESARVEPDELAEGDGYDRYLKPFRTAEDTHVFQALLAWHLGLARRSDWPEKIQEELLTRITTFRALALADPSSVALHLVLGRALEEAIDLFNGLDALWLTVDKATRQRWHRDRPLLRVAARARDARRERARTKLFGAPPRGTVPVGL